VGKLASFIQRRTALILTLSLLFSLVGGFFTVKLYKNLRTDIEELLPTESRSVKDLDEVQRRLKSIDNLAILVFSSNTEASRRFVIALANQIETFPKTEVAGVEYRIDHELEFFRKRQALYMELPDLERIRDFVGKRLQYERSLYNPLNIFSGIDIPEPEMDFRALRTRYERQAQGYAHFPGGFFATPDETKRVILIDVAGKTLGIDGVKRLKQRVESTIASLHPQSFAPDLAIHYTGSVQEMIEEQDALVEDLAVSSAAVLVLVTLAMLIFFQSFWATVALVGSLLASTLWTFGISYFAVGYLNANSAFLGSIVLGNGINFGIIFLARYLEERRLGRRHLRASRIAIPLTYKATLVAALAAGLSYGSLMLTSFRGFKQFGVIGLIGMALSWISSYTLLPALLTTLFRLRLLKKIAPKRRAYFTEFIAISISRFPRLIAGVSGILTVLAILLMTHVNASLLETNLENLRSKKSVESGAAFYTQYLNEIFERFLTPLVVLPSTPEKTLGVAAKLKELKRSQGLSSPIVSVQTVDDFIPKNQAEKIQVLREIRELLPQSILDKLDPEDQRKVHALLTPEVIREIKSQDLPPLVREKFTEKDGSIGKLVLVEPPLSRDIWQGDNLENFIGGIRKAADSVEPGAPVVGGMAITSDLVTSISHDGPRATLLSLIAAIFLVVIIFREPKTVCLSILALFIGVAWFGGLIMELEKYGLKINFLNFVALPITFGIGVDYGVNVFQRYRQQRFGGIVRTICETGGAVILCSLTTIIGYSSLLMASNKGFISFGLLAVLGEVTCVTAAVVALPAVLASFKK
jgi:predicted RND superfamily exporter protein